MTVSNWLRGKKRQCKFHGARHCPRLERLEARYVPSLVPLGPEYQVSTSLVGNPAHPAAASSSDGDVTVVWGSFGQDGDAWGVFGQRYGNDGQPSGGEFPINTVTLNNQFVVRRSIASDSAGNFVVVWTSGSIPIGGGRDDVFGRRFDANGVPSGPEFLVNTNTTVDHSEATIGMAPDGSFVVAWIGDDLPGGSIYDVYARRFDPNGTPVGAEFRVNTFTTSSQWLSSVALDGVGNAVIVWSSPGQDGSGRGIFAQRFSTSGTPIGTEFPVNTWTEGNQDWPSVASATDGRFVVTWEGAGPGDDSGVFARRFDSAGQGQGSEFLLSTAAVGDQYKPMIGMNPSGNFAIAWGNGSNASTNMVALRGFSADGVPQGEELVVTTTATLSVSSILSPALAMDSDGNVTVAWRSNQAPQFYIAGRRYAETGIAPAVQSVRVNNGAAQRSRIMDLTVTFSTQVTFAGGNAANAFTLIRDGGKAVQFSASSSVVNGVTVVTLSDFKGQSTQSGSLADGRYTLTVLASQVSANGQPMAEDHTFGDAQGLFRMYGDVNGDRSVDGPDFSAFSSTYGLFSTNPNFLWFLDVNGDGQVDGVELSQFSGRYNTILP